MRTNEIMRATEKRLLAGESITLPPLSVKTKKKLSFSCSLDAIGEGKIFVCHGKEISAGSWVEITKSTVCAFAFYSYIEPPLRPLCSAPVEHGLSIEGELYVEINADPATKENSVLIRSGGKEFLLALGFWDGCNGEILATAEGIDLSDCTLTFDSAGFDEEVFYLGDSFISLGSEHRWPYYLFRDGYKDLLLSGYPGMGSPIAAEQFHQLAKMARPKIAVWALGMNNGDKEAINENYLRATKDFIEVCEKNGITPVLSTIPNTPVVDNRYKNEWVRSLPYRYVDFATAVGSEEILGWYEGMLGVDGVHPIAKGAEALYHQLLKDVPEIMEKKGE